MTMTMATPTITVEELSRHLDRGEHPSVLDIRHAATFNEWHIPGSINIDTYDAIQSGDMSAIDAFDPPPGKPVTVVCEAGRTSVIAADHLRARGVPAQSLKGGMRAWSLAWNTAEIPLPRSETEIVQVRRTGKGCLSYLVGSNGEAAVIDASLDDSVYLRLARQYGWAISHVLETHVHADHLMRSRELAALTGAVLHLPATERARFPFSPLDDGDILDIGSPSIRVIHSPGHTQESVVFLVDGEATMTGDTLFLDGVGRPDLEASPEQIRQQAHQLFQSLSTLRELPPETLILPGHTNRPVPFDRFPLVAPLSDVVRRVDLLGQPESTFVDQLIARIPPSPPNHHQIVEINESGEQFEGDPVDLEAGANRCAVS